MKNSPLKSRIAIGVIAVILGYSAWMLGDMLARGLHAAVTAALN